MLGATARGRLLGADVRTRRARERRRGAQVLGDAGPLRQIEFLAYFEADLSGSIGVVFGMFLGVIQSINVNCYHCLGD